MSKSKVIGTYWEQCHSDGTHCSEFIEIHKYLILHRVNLDTDYFQAELSLNDHFDKSLITKITLIPGLEPSKLNQEKHDETTEREAQAKD